MFTSDKIVQYYKDNIKKAAPYVIHNLPYDISIIILEDLGKITVNGSINLNQANNIWNYCIKQLKKEGFDPYMLKEDGFKSTLKETMTDKIRKEKANAYG